MPKGVPIDPELLAFANKQKQGKSGGRGMIFSKIGDGTSRPSCLVVRFGG